MLGIFLDSETNGLNVHKHHICELAYRIVNVETAEVLDSYETLIRIHFEERKKSDPSSLEVNGFKWEDLENGKDPQEVANEVKLSFKRCGVERGKAVFICQNPSFDRAFFTQLINADTQEALNWPYHWLDLASMYWMKCLSEGKRPWETGVSKNEIAKSLGLPPEEEPHKAMNGVDHLLLCYKSVVGFESAKS